jgi:hypothetical protein
VLTTPFVTEVVVIVNPAAIDTVKACVASCTGVPLSVTFTVNE